MRFTVVTLCVLVTAAHGDSGSMRAGPLGLCDFDNINTVNNFDTERFSGTWYAYSRINWAEFAKDVNTAKLDYTAVEGGRLQVSEQYVFEDKSCYSKSAILSPEGQDGAFTVDASDVPQTVYVLATDYTSTAAILIVGRAGDGSVVQGKSTVSILIRDPDLGPTMSAVQESLVQQCGQQAGDLSSGFHRFIPNNYKRCPT